MPVARKKALIFVTSVGGKHYLPFLAPHMYTVNKCHPEAKEVMVWCDLPSREIELLRIAFPFARFLRVEEPKESDLNKRISRKLHSWYRGCHLYPDNPVCLIDCDTLLVRSIERFVTDDFDVLFTWKDELFPINTGVLLVKDGRTAVAFLEKWWWRTERIITDTSALSKALAVSGGADQHALREMIGFVNYDGRFTRNVSGLKLMFKGVPCRILNETNCVPITDQTHVIHYKAGWHTIIWREEFSEHRPKEKCYEMYRFWLETAARANRAVARDVVMHAASKSMQRFRQVIDGYEKRGILHSEMLAVCAVCDSLGVDVIIESGRARGQSTYVLARYFQGRPARIISIDWRGSDYFNEEDDKFARERLKPYSNIELLYEDSLHAIPRLARKLAGNRIALLLDGPKGQVAIDLLRTLITKSEDITAAFLHDVMKGTPQRRTLESVFSRFFFTDDEEYVKLFSELDVACASLGHWRPYWSQTYGQIESYGPTLAVVFPFTWEGFVKQSQKARMIEERWATLIKHTHAFIDVARHESTREAFRRALKWAYHKTRSLRKC